MRRLRALRVSARRRALPGVAHTQRGASRAPVWRQRVSIGLLTPLLLVVALWAPTLGLMGGPSTVQAAALDSPTLTITIPAPVVGVAEGPVGTLSLIHI